MPKKGKPKPLNIRKGIDARGRKRKRNQSKSTDGANETQTTLNTTQHSVASLAPVDEPDVMPKKRKRKPLDSRKGTDARGRKTKRNKSGPTNETQTTVDTTQQSVGSLASVDELLATEQFIQSDLNMGKTCVVPKCKSGYRSCKEKVSLFSIPKDRLESWQEVIPRTDRKLTCRDNICEKHFRKMYALKVPELAPNATPTKFPTCPKYEFRPKKENGIIKSIKPQYVKFTKRNVRTRQEHITNHEIDNRSKFMKKLKEDRQLFPRFGTFNKVEYDKLIDEVLKSKSLWNNKYRKEFDVVDIGSVKKLTAPIKKNGEIQFYVPDEDMFDVIHEAHQSVNHPGHESMFKELQKSFKNVTHREILIYLNLCCSCSSHTFEKMRSVKKKSVINSSSCSYASKNTFEELELVKESAFGYNSFSSKCDVNIIDHQSNPDTDYKFILVYQNHLTKFCMLKALKSLTVDEIYYNLCDIFAFIGVPKIINSEICDESLNEVIKKIRKRLPELLIQHIKSKGSIELLERVTEDVEAWMKRKSTNTWNEALRFIQLSINKDLDEKLNRIPFETVFGMPTFEEEREPTENCIEIEPIDQNVTVLANEEISNSSIKQEPMDHDENCMKEEPIMYQDLVVKEESVEIVSNICDVCKNDMGSEEGCYRCEQKVMKSESHNESTQDEHWPLN